MFRFDETDPHYLIAYEEQHEHSIAPYQELMRRWLARFENGDVFGVILVSAEEQHGGDDHPEGRDVAFEEAFSALLNDFRRDHKQDVACCTVGFARVLPQRWLDEQRATNPDALNDMSAQWERTARYMWGVPGMMCASIDEARAWLEEQFLTFAPPDDAAPADTAPAVGAAPQPRRVGLFYGSTTGNTEYMAEEIAQAWAEHGMEPVTALNVGKVKNLAAMLDYDCLILGIPTWHVGQLQDDWDIAFPQLDTLDFTGKRVALFGVGDQQGYPDNFLDAVGILGEKLIARGATLVGSWSTEGYDFSESKALVDGSFMGLGLDDENQSDLTDSRIHQWVGQLIREFALQPAR